MEKIRETLLSYDNIRKVPNIVSIAKPPWTNRKHSGKLERLILQLGEGKGEFSEITGIPRSIGCIGNNNFILRREPLSDERMMELINEFYLANGRELYLTNYDSAERLMKIAEYAVSIGIPNVYVILRIEDVDKVNYVKGVKVIVEAVYSRENIEKIESLNWAYGALIIITQEKYKEFLNTSIDFEGEIYLDVIYPGSLKKVKLNLLELKRTRKPDTNVYHDCLSGNLTITADGYALPCPLLRGFVIGDAKEEGIRKLARKNRLRKFWKMTKNEIESCAHCPFRYICHDCRAIEFQASGDPFGIEFCPLEV
jgi:radical SAM protein with 4Fe4S-binding SPASM domain